MNCVTAGVHEDYECPNCGWKGNKSYMDYDDKKLALNCPQCGKTIIRHYREAKIVNMVVASTMHMAWGGTSIRLPLERGFYHPKDVAMEMITPEGTDLDIRAYQQNGRWIGVAFAGKANRPLWNYSFRDRSQLDRKIAETVEDRKKKMEYKQNRMEEKRQFSHSLKEGDILYASWGYDQTNVDFYQVTEVGAKSVKIREIGQKVVGGSVGSDLVVPVPNHFTGPEQMKIVSTGNSVRIKSYSSAYRWDGKPQHQTAPGYGH
jgi:predicted RNA-binding Zn-ribbon protein involved in translation (DUF1610 family)